MQETFISGFQTLHSYCEQEQLSLEVASVGALRGYLRYLLEDELVRPDSEVWIREDGQESYSLKQTVEELITYLKKSPANNHYCVANDGDNYKLCIFDACIANLDAHAEGFGERILLMATDSFYQPHMS